MPNIKSKVSKSKRAKPSSELSAAMHRLGRNRTAMVGLTIFLILFALAVLAPWIMPYDYQSIDLQARFATPNAKHWFGCDEFGRDIFSRLLYGGRYSLTVGLLATGGALIVGVIMGSVAGFFGGWVDTILMRFLDIFQSIPGTLFTICVAAALGTGFDKTILALAITRSPGMARTLRASIMKTRNEEYVEAARATGCGTLRTIIRYVLPNSFSPLLVQTTMGVAQTMLTTASLSYIGLGIQPPTPEWGAMLSGAKNYIRDYPHMLLFPGLAIAITVLGLNMFGDGLRDALDPKLKD